MRWRWSRSLSGLGLGRLSAIVLLGLLTLIRIFDPPAVEMLRESSFELYRMLEGDPAQAFEANVVAVAIDEASLATYGQWPWPRRKLGQLVQIITEGRPRVTALNVLLSEPGRLSPQVIVDSFGELGPEARREILLLPSGDEGLADALAQGTVVLAMAVTTDPVWLGSDSVHGDRYRHGERDVVLAGPRPQHRAELPVYGGLVRSLPVFTDVSAGEGVANFGLVGGKVRWLPSVVRVGQAVLPSLAMEILKTGAGAGEIVVLSGRFGIEGLSIGPAIYPTDRRGRFRPRFRADAEALEVSAGAVLAGEVAQDFFRDRYVIIGVTASGLAESFATTAAGTLTGLQIQAQAVESLIAGDLVVRPAWSTPLELLLVLGSGILLILVLPMFRVGWEVVLLMAILTGLGALAIGGYLASGLLLDASWATLSCVAVFVLLACMRLVAEGQHSREFSKRMRILESTLDAVPVPVMICSLLDDEILYANASARETIALPEVPAGSSGGTAMLRYGAGWQTLLNHLHIEGRVDGLEVPTDTPGGAAVSLLAARRVDYQGRDAVLVACVDITERKRMEDDLRSSRDEAKQANERLREAHAELVQAEKMASLGGLVAGVAHEINTPIGIALAGSSHLVDRSHELRRVFEKDHLRRSDLGEYLDAVQETAQLVTANIERAADLIQAFKRVSVDQVSQQRQVFDLQDYLEDIVASLAPELNRRQCRVELTCPSGIVVDSYPGALALIVTNLVMNALTHAFGPGEAGVIRITAELLGETVELRCTDNGKGISQEIASRIFDPFFTTRRGQGGSGLGLYLVFNTIAQVLRGRIEVASREGEGTRFIVQFPRLASTAELLAPDPATVRTEEQPRRT